MTTTRQCHNSEHTADCKAAGPFCWPIEEAELVETCNASTRTGGSDPWGITCDLDPGHDGAHEMVDPFGDDTGTWTWTANSRITRKD